MVSKVSAHIPSQSTAPTAAVKPTVTTTPTASIRPMGIQTTSAPTAHVTPTVVSSQHLLSSTSVTQLPSSTTAAATVFVRSSSPQILPPAAAQVQVVEIPQPPLSMVAPMGNPSVIVSNASLAISALPVTTAQTSQLSDSSKTMVVSSSGRVASTVLPFNSTALTQAIASLTGQMKRKREIEEEEEEEVEEGEIEDEVQEPGSSLEPPSSKKRHIRLIQRVQVSASSSIVPDTQNSSVRLLCGDISETGLRLGSSE